MGEQMQFPETLDEFIKQYSFIDHKEFYTNGSELIQVFRIKQWEEHTQKENKELKEKLGQKNKVIEEIKNIIQKHTYTQKDDYYDYCEQGISIVDSDDDYDKLIDILNKGVDE